MEIVRINAGFALLYHGRTSLTRLREAYPKSTYLKWFDEGGFPYHIRWKCRTIEDNLKGFDFSVDYYIYTDAETGVLFRLSFSEEDVKILKIQGKECI